MRGPFYKALGFAVWKGGKWYLRRRVGWLPSRKVLAAGAVAVAVGTAIAVGAKRDAGDAR
jgi:hypothetical protein